MRETIRLVIKMEDKASTKKKLLRTGIKLFAEYGYAATSTRMIASAAGVNLSAISFHFNNKECLYVACLEYVHEKIIQYYETSYAEIEEAFQKNQMTAELAYHYLGRMLDQQMEVAFEKKYQTTLSLIYQENKAMEQEIRPLSAVVFEKQEYTMARLIRVLAPKVTEKQAIIASRQINGSIIAFGEHRNLLQMKEELDEEYKDLSWIRDEVKNNCLAIVKNLMDL